jgi:hypothetical protein
MIPKNLSAIYQDFSTKPWWIKFQKMEEGYFMEARKA